MKKTFVLVATLLMFINAHGNDTMADLFSTEEAHDLIEVISRMHPMTLVAPSSFAAWQGPQICWIDDPRSRVLNQVLPEYRGALHWVLASDLPRSCLMPALVDVTDYEYVSVSDFRNMAVRDLDPLSKFLERKLELAGKPSLGIRYHSENLDLAKMSDQRGPGGGIYVVADPVEFGRNQGFPTSQFDRELHFWITVPECEELYSVLTERGQNPELPNFPLLARVARSRFETLIVRPEEIRTLVAEIEKLRPAEPQLVGALDRLLRACQSAIAYKLGFYANRV